MQYIKWTDDYATGINVIDGQHKRIIHYINQLGDAGNLNETDLTGEILINLIDYTLSHFAFEESLMDDVEYNAANIHKQTHDAFREKIGSYKQRFESGEDIADELYQLLNIWLVGHIKDDDGSYVPVVKEKIPLINGAEKQGWLANKITHFFE
jgi:hemerythrin